MTSHLLGDRIGLGKCLESRFILPWAAFLVGADEAISLELLELCCEIGLLCWEGDEEGAVSSESFDSV